MTKLKFSQLKAAKALLLESIALFNAITNTRFTYRYSDKVMHAIERAERRVMRRSRIHSAFFKSVEFPVINSELAQPFESVSKVQAATFPRICPECKGIGSVYPFPPIPVESHLMVDREECPRCSGTGQYTQDYEDDICLNCEAYGSAYLSAIHREDCSLCFVDSVQLTDSFFDSLPLSAYVDSELAGG